MGDLRYCFERQYVERTLGLTKSRGLAVVDLEGVTTSAINKALARNVFIYAYLNAGALEKGRPYYGTFKNFRLAQYEGWPGEFWIDPTAKGWRSHLINQAAALKKRGAIGLYMDNLDIYYMVKEGFEEQKADMIRTIPASGLVYEALADTICQISKTGMIVMPNGGDMFVRKFIKENPGVIKTINQEGICYEDKKAQSKEEKKYRTEYVNWCKRQGIYIRGIEYPKNSAQALIAKAYYKRHGWQGIYISYHKDLRGD